MILLYFSEKCTICPYLYCPVLVQLIRSNLSESPGMNETSSSGARDMTQKRIIILMACDAKQNTFDAIASYYDKKIVIQFRNAIIRNVMKTSASKPDNRTRYEQAYSGNQRRDS